MSEQPQEDPLYDLMVDSETGDLKPKVDKILDGIFKKFDKDGDGKWDLEELQEFAKATNGCPFDDCVIDEIIESFQVDKENRLLFEGFYEMYYMQTISEPGETLKDFKKHGYDDKLDLVSSRIEESEKAE
ncbi:hypothetical protein [Parasitella parasitica]|uniref:EF-hand domain-containing protein n=1 Tax=Parasitella parasitica TaxID=35722 RepID=A0A0B7NIB4_9FUNG|nr:hypothetical protein [Parasitella parasitica]